MYKKNKEKEHINMSRSMSLIQKRFGKLIVIRQMDNNKNGKSRWLCRCDCSKEKIIIGCDLQNGHTKSCGCLRNEIIRQRSTKHGHSTHRKSSKIYVLWTGIKQRCTNSNFKQYKDYGGRGISVCQRWMKFENFLADMGDVPKGHQIDRIDNNGNYCPENCRWVTPKQNSRNRRDSCFIAHDGNTQCLASWEEKTGICRATIRWRLNNGWSTRKALTTPTRERKIDV